MAPPQHSQLKRRPLAARPHFSRFSAARSRSAVRKRVAATDWCASRNDVSVTRKEGRLRRCFLTASGPEVYRICFMVRAFRASGEKTGLTSSNWTFYSAGRSRASSVRPATNASAFDRSAARGLLFGDFPGRASYFRGKLAEMLAAASCSASTTLSTAEKLQRSAKRLWRCSASCSGGVVLKFANYREMNARMLSARSAALPPMGMSSSTMPCARTSAAKHFCARASSSQFWPKSRRICSAFSP